MLKQISVKNIGCFDDKSYTVDFSEETLIAGPNNTGKSMLFAAMDLARFFIVTGSQSWDAEYYNLHGFHASVYAHEPDRRIGISFTIDACICYLN